MIMIHKQSGEYLVFKFLPVEFVGIANNINELFELLQDSLTETKKDEFPAVGKPYWYVTAPTPFSVSVNQGVIDEGILNEIKENGKCGNIFKTKQEAKEMARKMVKLFETHNISSESSD